jgi:hypothetical protein
MHIIYVIFLRNMLGFSSCIVIQSMRDDLCIDTNLLLSCPVSTLTGRLGWNRAGLFCWQGSSANSVEDSLSMLGVSDISTIVAWLT